MSFGGDVFTQPGDSEPARTGSQCPCLCGARGESKYRHAAEKEKAKKKTKINLTNNVLLLALYHETSQLRHVSLQWRFLPSPGFPP